MKTTDLDPQRLKILEYKIDHKITVYDILKDLKDGTEKNDQGIRNYQNLQTDAYKGSNRASGNEKI